jgi:protein-S-isoprenylcysteine O-methyltransferase Ste14
MNIFGIGPKIVISGVLSFAAILIIGSGMEHIGYWFVPRAILIALGSAFVIIGLYFWLDAVRLIMMRFKQGVLVLDGVYRFVRNPMYAGFIVFIVPGLSFILNSPLIMLSSITMLLVFKMNIYKEEEYLLQQFGQAYLDYRLKVKQIIPFIW